MSVVNVGNPLSEGITCFYTREFTQEKGLTSVVNAGNLLTIDGHSFNTREFIQEKSLMCVIPVGRHLLSLVLLSLILGNIQVRM